MKTIKLLWRKWFGEPNDFYFVSQTEGVPVGPEMEVTHLTLHDCAEYACCWELTAAQILHGIKANAIRITGFRRTDKYNGITTFVPCQYQPAK